MKNNTLTNDFLGGKSNREVVDMGNLKITSNAIYYCGSVLQISNINHMYIKKFMKDPFPIWTILGIILGFLIFLITSIAMKSFNFFSVLGIAAIAISIYFIRKYYQDNKNDKFGLYIQMSSGFFMIIGSEDYSFLEKVQDIIANNFVENNNMPTTINLDNKQIIIGKNDGIVSTGDYAKNESIHRM